MTPKTRPLADSHGKRLDKLGRVTNYPKAYRSAPGFGGSARPRLVRSTDGTGLGVVPPGLANRPGNLGGRNLAPGLAQVGAGLSVGRDNAPGPAQVGAGLSVGRDNAPGTVRAAPTYRAFDLRGGAVRAML